MGNGGIAKMTLQRLEQICIMKALKALETSFEANRSNLDPGEFGKGCGYGLTMALDTLRRYRLQVISDNPQNGTTPALIAQSILGSLRSNREVKIEGTTLEEIEKFAAENGYQFDDGIDYKRGIEVQGWSRREETPKEFEWQLLIPWPDESEAD